MEKLMRKLTEKQMEFWKENISEIEFDLNSRDEISKGTLRLNCKWDFEKVHEIANNHIRLRQVLGHRKNDSDSRYSLQTIKDIVKLAVVFENKRVWVKT